MKKDVLLALGLVLSPASQLRLGGGAIGPGELCFALWLVLAAIQYFGRTDLPLTSAPARMLRFWLLFAAALSIGALTTYALGIRNDPALFKHDIQAYILVAGISLFCVLDPQASIRLNKVAWLVAVLGSTFLALQLGHAWGFVGIAQIDPWYWNRFRGWSENPNQLALMCIVVLFISVHLAETAARPGITAAALACSISPLLAGLATKSDSFLLVMAIACPAYVILNVGRWLGITATVPGVRWAIAWFCVLSIPVVLMLAAPAAYVAAANSDSLERQFTESIHDAIERDAPERFKLWTQAIDIGMSSGMLGLGPGPHLIRTKPARVNHVNTRAGTRHPSEHPLPDFETHNTVLDLFTQGGVLAVASFGWLCIATFLITIRAQLNSLAALLCGLAVFGTFHLIVRHPLLWFVIALCLVTATQCSRLPSHAENRS